VAKSWWAAVRRAEGKLEQIPLGHYWVASGPTEIVRGNDGLRVWFKHWALDFLDGQCESPVQDATVAATQCFLSQWIDQPHIIFVSEEVSIEEG
jgi:hypothetical protein